MSVPYPYCTHGDEREATCRGCADPYCPDCIPDPYQRILDLEGAVDDLRAECRRLRAELAARAPAPAVGAPRLSLVDDPTPF